MRTAREAAARALVRTSGEAVYCATGRRSEYFSPALCCGRCEESVDLDEPFAVLARFAVDHKGCGPQWEGGDDEN